MPMFNVGDLVEVDNFKSHKVAGKLHPKNGVVLAVFNQQDSPSYIGEKTHPQYHYVVKVEHPDYGSPLSSYEKGFAAWLYNNNKHLDMDERVVVVEQLNLTARIDLNRYPSTCPNCKAPAYVGAVPNSIACSNQYCKYVEKKKK